MKVYELNNYEAQMILLSLNTEINRRKEELSGLTEEEKEQEERSISSLEQIHNKILNVKMSNS